MTEDFAERIALLAIDGIAREFPNKIAHVMHSDGDALPPRKLTPAFFGCFDWHSAVHSHWCLVRLLRFAPKQSWTDHARETLNRSFTPQNIAGELRYLTGPDREGFERPYGLAWLLQLCAELREWDDAAAGVWLNILRPLEELAADRFRLWLPKLTHPIRTGEHSQTAFAMGLVLDWSLIAGDEELTELVRNRALDFHADDVNAPLHFEPSGHDFLSPCLAEADLMRRCLNESPFTDWLSQFLTDLPTDGRADWLPPAKVSDPTDGKLAHLHGLNLSRAWMLRGIADGLPADDPRAVSLRAAAENHVAAGLPAVTGEHYSISHWLGSFAVYLLTNRGIGLS